LNGCFATNDRITLDLAANLKINASWKNGAAPKVNTAMTVSVLHRRGPVHW